MIVTVTPNPSIDRTVTLGTPLTRGAVHRVTSATTEPGGKGVNVARALHAGGRRRRRRPARRRRRSDRGRAARRRRAPSGACRWRRRAHQPHDHRVRRNHNQTERAGGRARRDARSTRSTRAVVDAAAGASWVVLSGSLPPGVPDDWYAEVVPALAAPCRVAVDTSEGPLAALAAAFGRAAPDLHQTERRGTRLVGRRVARRARKLLPPRAIRRPWCRRPNQLDRAGRPTVLVTLGAAGAVLVDPTGAWMATPPPITPRSTVGAGDSALAGYLRAEVGGAEPPQRLQMAVAYGSAAAALPGSGAPRPDQIDLAAVRVYAITPASSRP